MVTMGKVPGSNQSNSVAEGTHGSMLLSTGYPDAFVRCDLDSIYKSSGGTQSK